MHSLQACSGWVGRQPKKRIDISDLRPVFTLNDKDGLRPGEELVELATKLGIAHAVEGNKMRRKDGE